MFELAREQVDVGVVPHDIDAMITFYRDVLGLEPRSSFPVPKGRLEQFRIGDGTLRLYCVTPSPPREAPSAHAVGLRQLIFATPDLEGAVRRAEACAVAVRRFDEGESGQPVAVMADPDGNEVRLHGVSPADGLSLHVGMAVADLSRARRFYDEQLGLQTDARPVVWDGTPRCHVRIGRSMLSLWQADDGAPVHSGPVLARAGIRYVAIAVADAGAAAKALLDRGVSIPIGPRTSDGFTFFVAVDPDSNSIEFLSNGN